MERPQAFIHWTSDGLGFYLTESPVDFLGAHLLGPDGASDIQYTLTPTVLPQPEVRSCGHPANRGALMTEANERDDPETLECECCGFEITDRHAVAECLEGGRHICDDCLEEERLAEKAAGWPPEEVQS